MRSIALSIAHRVQGLDAQAEDAARLIADEASRLYDAMHGMIPRLTPLVLDSFGLAEALGDLVERTRRSHAGLQIELSVELGDAALGSDTTLALYRAAQEGISNALRHGQAGRIDLRVAGTADAVTLDLRDDGTGLLHDWSERAGHHGLRWLAERVEALGGAFHVEAAAPRGVRLQVQLPLTAPAEAVGVE
jgi:two-component system sensor histidine kinase UhpB